MVHCGKWSCSLDLLLDLLWASNFVSLDGHVVKLYLYIFVSIYIQCTGLCSQRLFHLLQFRCLDKEICSDFCAVSLPLKQGMLPSESHPRFFMAAANYLLQVLTIKLWLLTSYMCSMLLFPAQKNGRLDAFLFIFTCCFWLHKTTFWEVAGIFLLSPRPVHEGFSRVATRWGFFAPTRGKPPKTNMTIGKSQFLIGDTSSNVFLLPLSC